MVLQILGLILIVFIVAVMAGLYMAYLNQVSKRPCKSVSDRYIQRIAREAEQGMYKDVFKPMINEILCFVGVILLALFMLIAKAFS